ncbi:MAG: precorrin-3B C(17)-methyltransferase [Deltaproteobacteria bacterium]|nr:precorrin-3B C(17)-methyltransferase [Deltaproteobacteria bacterium]
MRSCSSSGIGERGTDRSQADQPECHPGRCPNQLFVVGLGPGSPDYLSKRAGDVLEAVDTVAGYTTYLDLIRPLIQNKRIISSAMTQEVDRVEAAIAEAMSGKSCAIVSSGDSGIYAMAGLVLEICAIRGIPVLKPETRAAVHPEMLQVEIVPGIPAVCAGASLLGAPLTHDFACISLSDLLTPWEIIEKRLNATALADFVIVLYNPKSKRRSTQLERAQQIILKHRDKNTPVGIVTSAMREEQEIDLTTLEHLHLAKVTMLSTVFIGNSSTFEYQGLMITPRGYSKKYDIR